MKRNSAIMNSDTDKICNDIKNKLLNKFDNDIEGIILFGSASRNELKEDSDIDIAVITSDQEENIMTFFSEYKSDVLIDYWIVPIGDAEYLAGIGDYRYGKNLLEEGNIIYDKGRMKELKELSTISEPGEEFINLSLERCRKHDEVAKEHVGYVMRSVYQSCINLGYALLAKKCIKLKTCEIYDKLTELEETKEYVSFLKDLKYSMRNEDYSRLKEYLEKFESMKELLKIFE